MFIRVEREQSQGNDTVLSSMWEVSIENLTFELNFEDKERGERPPRGNDLVA